MAFFLKQLVYLSCDWYEFWTMMSKVILKQEVLYYEKQQGKQLNWKSKAILEQLKWSLIFDVLELYL
jgi:hypothetical protein